MGLDPFFHSPFCSHCVYFCAHECARSARFGACDVPSRNLSRDDFADGHQLTNKTFPFQTFTSIKELCSTTRFRPKWLLCGPYRNRFECFLLLLQRLLLNKYS